MSFKIYTFFVLNPFIMLNITTWIELPKMLGDFSLGNENLLKNSLLVFENIESKIENMKQKLFENSELSIHEIEAYSRSLNNLTRLLVKN